MNQPPLLPRPEWAERIIQQLDQIGTVVVLKEHVQKLSKAVSQLMNERKKLKAQVDELNEQLMIANERAFNAENKLVKLQKVMREAQSA